MKSQGSATWQVITDESGLLDIREDWNQLFAANPRHRPFQSWSWVSAWLKHLAGEYELHTLCLRDTDNQLQILLPMIRSRGNGLYRSPRLCLMCGYGPECSDHIGALRLPTLDPRISELIVQGLAESWNSSDRIELGNLENLDGFSLQLAPAFQQLGRVVSINESALCPAAALPDTWEDYLQSLSSNFRSQVRRFHKRVEKTENTKFRSLAAEDAEMFAEALIRLNRSRMGHKGQTSSLENPALREFLVDVIPGMAQAGLALMDVVELDEKIVGAALNLVHGKSAYFYMGGFDDSAKSLRPGTALFARVIERAIEDGYTSYDFLRGAESYKYKWGATDVHNYHLTVYPEGAIRGQLACGLDNLKNHARTLVRGMRK